MILPSWAEDLRDAEVASCLRLPENERPLYVLPFGEVTE